MYKISARRDSAVRGHKALTLQKKVSLKESWMLTEELSHAGAEISNFRDEVEVGSFHSPGSLNRGLKNSALRYVGP